MREKRRPPGAGGPLFLTPIILTFGTVVIALAIALSLIFYYLRKKSLEARQVLARLESGDLKARFKIERFDQSAGLILDFNRMAEEIEKLVMRLHTVESTRKNLLQELGHDLRTPLTSMNTAFETLKNYSDKMSGGDKQEMYDLISSEISYFKELLEKLITIASLDEPHYKKETEIIDVKELLAGELRTRVSASDKKIEWSLLETGSRTLVVGDVHLILRLFKNALDNAARYANHAVRVEIQNVDSFLQVRVIDDGSGLSEKNLQSFGTRRDYHGRQKDSKAHFSLGLGSVIMKTIAELHSGTIQIENLGSEGRVQGAMLTIRLPLVRSGHDAKLAQR
jgi:K+-sensing histidine kinase KdpD